MGVYLSEPQTSKKTCFQENDKLSFCSSQMQGWRKNMEDAVIHQKNLGDGNALFSVFDGHGGPEVSLYVSQKFKKILTDDPAYKNGNYIKALDEAFRKMDQSIKSSQGAKDLQQIRTGKKPNEMGGGQDQISSGTGCTANVLLITPTKYYVANAGDSRSVLCRKDKIQALSQDHKPQSPQEQKRIIQAGGSIVMGRVNGGLNLTRSFGDFDYKRNSGLGYDKQMITCKPDIKEFERKPNDQFILMGCDGIWQKYVTDSQGLIKIVKQQLNKNKNSKQKQKLQKVVQGMLDNLLAKNTSEGIGCDNMSAILIKFK